MSTLATTPPASDWHAAFRELGASWGPVALFSLKTGIAALLALWIAFRIDLPSPSSAMITVFIVAQPLSGLVLEKSLYRLMGTLVGSIMTLLMVGLFAQQRELFLATMALWIGLCTTGATWFRSYQSYAFVLAGYTAVLIGFSAVLHPEQALEIAIDRVSVVALGILCAGFVSDGLFPQRLSARLVALVRGRSITLYRTIEDALLRPTSAEHSNQRQTGLMSSVFQFESSRSAAAVEDPEARARSARLQRLNAQFMAVTSTLHVIERTLQRLRDGGNQDLCAALQALAQALCKALLLNGEPPHVALQAAAMLPQLRQLRGQLPARIAATRSALPVSHSDEQRIRFDTVAQLLQQLTTELIGYTETYSALRRVREVHARPAPRYRLSVDPQLALLNGLRAAVAMLVTSGFWIVTAWPDAIPAIINAAVFSALFGTSPDPLQSIRGLLRGFGFGFVAALACGLWLLPQVSGFPLLAACLLPFLLPGFIWLTQPANAGMGIGYLIMLVVCVAPANPMHFDAARLVNIGLSQFLGVSVAMLAFSILVPDGHLRGRARLQLRLRNELIRLCREPLRGLRHRFESASRDLLQQQRQPVPSASVVATLAALELGHALLSLRRALIPAQLPAPAREAGQAAQRSIMLLLQTPCSETHTQVIETLRQSLDQIQAQTQTDNASMITRRRMHQALQYLNDILSDNDLVSSLIHARSTSHAA